MFRTFAWLAAIISALWLSAAAALGLGEIDVHSKLNQRFSAVIPVTSITADDAETAIVTLATNEDFERAGIERTDYLSTLTFAMKTENGASRIVVTSPQLAREPYLTFLVDVRTNSRRVQREYSVLLDPVESTTPAKPAPAKPAPAAASQFYETPEEATSHASSAPAAAAQTPAAPSGEYTYMPTPGHPAAAAPAAAVQASGATYGPVQPKETLWSIATKLRPEPSITMDQVLLALYQKNPKAFDRYPGLLKGSVLQVPSAAEMRSATPAAAKQHLAELSSGASTAPSAAAAPAHVRKPRTTPPAEITPQIIPPPAEKPAKPSPALVPPPAPKVETAPVPPPAKKPEPAAPPPASIVPPPVVQPPHPAAAPIPALVPPPAAKPAPVTPPPASITPPPAAATPAPAPAPAITAAPAPSAEPPAAITTTTTASSAAPEPALTPSVAVEAPPPHAMPPVVLEQPAAVEDEGNPMVRTLLIGVGALILLGGAGFGAFLGWKKMKERKAAGGSAEVTPAAAPAPKPVRPPKNMMPPPAPPAQVSKSQLQQLEETIIDSPQVNTAAAAMEEPGARTRPVENRLAATSQTADFNATHSLDEPFTLPSTSGGQKASERVDFDVTSQFAESTMSINLDANDPVSEADFHLAYGLYDEAALLLKQAAEKDPKRTELRVKLAETYFAASRPQEFLEVASTLKNEMATGEWQKLAIMGRQLCPDAALFKGADESAALGGEVDLSFDEPSAPVAAPPPPPSRAAPAASAPLDFKLEELELSQLEPTRLVSREAAAPAPADDGGALDFKLEDIELTPSTEAGSEMSGGGEPSSHTIDFDSTSIAAAPAPSPPRADQMTRTGGFTASAAATDNFEELSTQTAVMSDGGGKSRGNEVSLDDFDLGDDSNAISSGDEAGTKLDLARAYADMGDNDMAKTLLKEVVDSGNAEQKKEAQALIGRLS